MAHACSALQLDGQVRVVDVPRPSGDGVRVAHRAGGICGSDLHMLEHGYPSRR